MTSPAEKYSDRVDGRIKVMIVDDNLAAIEQLAAQLASGYGMSAQLVATATNTRDAEGLIQSHRPDLLFLDVELPDAMGVDYARDLRARLGDSMKIVMYTSYEKYLIDALRANAFDFLLKPLDPSELATVMTRYVTHRGSGNVEPMHREETSTAHTPRRLLLTTATSDKLVVLPDQVGYFRYLSDRKRWEAVLDSAGSCQLFGQTTAEDILSMAPQYVRIHKTFIININHLAIIQDNTCIMMPPFDTGDSLKVSKNYRKDLVDRFYSL